MIPRTKPKGWALVDGDPTQIDHIQQVATKYGATVSIILDIIHVLEYLWKAANALFDAEDAKGAPWVADRIEQLLQGQRPSLVRRYTPASVAPAPSASEAASCA